MADLSVRGVGKSFGDQPVLANVSLEVASGSLIAVLGRSGSGKTTLLRLICGFERSDAGAIVIDGRTMSDGRTHVRAEHRHIGYVAQEGALFPHLRVAENITFGLRAAGRRARERVGAMLALVGLPDAYADRWPQELSGGEQQRVALARALAPGPQLVLLDEPFSSLDAALRSETRNAVAAALREAGATAILVTHDQSEALSMGQQVAVLRGGRLVQTASPEVLYRQPADAELARFVGEAVTMPGVAAHGVGRCRLGALQLISPVPDGPVDIMIRPEQVRLVPTPETADQSATVVEVVFFGPDAKVTLAVADGASLTARVAGHQAPAIGTRVGLRIEGGVIAFARASG